MSEQLTDAEAEAMLARLEEHYLQPVMPVERYCDALRTWARKMAERYGWDSEEARQLGWVEMSIRKSDLLARMIYGGEPLRTIECPEHKGRWSGINPCRHGCQSTGWVPDDWPDSAPRCTAHPDRPAVSVSVHISGERRELCFECWEARWS